MNIRILRIFPLLLVLLLAFNFLSAEKAQAASLIVFPVIGNASYSNDYNAPRSNGPHHAIDIIAGKGQKLVAAVEGTIVHVVCPQQSWGYSLTIQSDAGYRYRYIHINNDTPGTDDGKGGCMGAYAQDMKVGNRVRRGQHVGWVGDSGNAENTVSHLHFEMFKPDGSVTNPYAFLNSASRVSKPHLAAKQSYEMIPYGESRAGVNIDLGNFDGDDEEPEILTGWHSGGSPRVRLFNDDGSQAFTFLAYDRDFKGGVDVAAGDVDGDGTDEIITAAGRTGSPRVRLFEPSGTPIKDFWAYSDSFKGGVRVTAGDIDNDGDDEIITGASAGTTPRVRVFDWEAGAITVVEDFLAFRSGFRGGIDVASADVAGLTEDEIIVSIGRGGSPYVKTFTPAGANLETFLAYSESYSGGVRISAGNVNTGFGSLKSEIATVPMSSYLPVARLYDGTGDRIDSNSDFMEDWWRGYYDVGAGIGEARVSSGVNRRNFVRPGF